MKFELKGRPIVAGLCKGLALVSKKSFSFLGGIDPETGIVIEKGHDLKGKSVKGTVLFFPNSHGSTVGSYVLYSLVRKGAGPKAIVNVTADPIVVAGAVIAGIPMIDRIDFSHVRTGDIVEVDGETGSIKVMAEEEHCI